MSSTRRTANEINILAMLDRNEAAGLPRRVLRRLRGLPAAAWYGAAGVLVCALVGTLAWLARDSDSSASVDTALAGAVSAKPAAPIAAAEPAPADAPAGASAGASADAPPDAAPAAGATIVDVAPAPAAEPAAPAHPQQQHAGHIAPHEFACEPQRLAAAVNSAPHAAVGKSSTAGTRQALAHAEPRGKRHAQLPKAAPEPVDTDVALISAIIQHVNKRQEAEEAARKP